MTPEHRQPRRRDRSKPEGWIRAFLRRGEAAVLSAVKDGRPVSLPRVYAYDEEREAVYFHGAHGGEMGGILEEADPGTGAPVSLTVYEMGRLLPAEEAGEFGVEYASVVVAGRGRVVEDPAEAEHGLRLLMEKYAPHLKEGQDYDAISPEELFRTSVVRVDVEAWSGKAKEAPQDFPGAYWLRDVAAP